MSQHKLTIITINFNNREGLKRTLKSIAEQTTREFQYIVIDGGSTDGSVEIIREYEDYIDFWVSEPDKGIYNAMNKGVSHATGEYCNFLNSGDYYYSSDVVESFNQLNTVEDVVEGAIALCEGDTVLNTPRRGDGGGEGILLRNRRLQPTSGFGKLFIICHAS